MDDILFQLIWFIGVFLILITFTGIVFVLDFLLYAITGFSVLIWIEAKFFDAKYYD